MNELYFRAVCWREYSGRDHDINSERRDMAPAQPLSEHKSLSKSIKTEECKSFNDFIVVAVALECHMDELHRKFLLPTSLLFTRYAIKRLCLMIID